MSVDSFSAAVAAGDDKSLSQISGIGKKTAQRIVVELKDKIGKTMTVSIARRGDGRGSPDEQKTQRRRDGADGAGIQAGRSRRIRESRNGHAGSRRRGWKTSCAPH